MSLAVIDLAALPAPEVVASIDYEAILARRKARLLALAPQAQRAAFEAALALESEPLTLLLEEMAYDELLMRAALNDAARALLLVSATGGNLEQLGALFGVARLPDEGDARLRMRVQQGFSALGVAGPAAAYRAHALNVSAAVVDVSVVSAAPGRIDVTVLGWESAAGAAADAIALGGVLFPGTTANPGEAVIPAAHDSLLLAAVRTRLSSETVRPLTDAVVVTAPTVRQTTVAARLHVFPGPDPALVRANALASLTAHLAGRRRLGRDLTRAGIIGALAVPGVQNVLLDAPAIDIVCTAADICVVSQTTLAVTEVVD